MRRSSLPHKPKVDVSNQRMLDAYCDGLYAGQHGKLHEPRPGLQPDERANYTAGFERAREEPRIHQCRK